MGNHCLLKNVISGEPLGTHQVALVWGNHCALELSFSMHTYLSWERRHTPHGRHYFINHYTRTTQWERPTRCMSTTVNPQARPPAMSQWVVLGTNYKYTYTYCGMLADISHLGRLLGVQSTCTTVYHQLFFSLKTWVRKCSAAARLPPSPSASPLLINRETGYR